MKLSKILLGLAFAGAMAVSSPAIDIGVRIGPPRPIVERRVPAPGPGYVWVNGYQNWNGSAYVWVPGRWDRPPHRGARWVPDRWQHRRDGWHRTEGHWR